MGSRSILTLAAVLMLVCCSAAQPAIAQVNDALEPNGRKVLGLIGPFQQKVVAAGAVGAASGYQWGSFAGPAGSAVGAAGGAAANAGGYVLSHHAETKWTNGGLNNWNRPSRWGRKMLGFGGFQQGVIGAAAVGGATGGLPGAAVGAGTYIATNHAQQRWTGNGLQNWNRPSRWG